ncbi:MAG: hypothetical protein J4203_01200 [Candidatus Diapherotrites archaeon]|uniref:Uncharacterized protein n=1 Tax=Candidatus Iainarchaeum sp. TaxID=3101447 RepID=A0A8T4L7D1_9ARCH|nr:hypothetical protein [Candidatus Diapherotrites archaeon]
MPNMTLSIPKPLHEEMKKYPEYKWSEVARKAIQEKIEAARLADDLKAIAQAKKELREGKTVPLEKLAEELGLK